MKLTDSQIKKLAQTLLDRLSKKNLLEPKVPVQKILEKIEGIFLADARIEQEIEAVAKKMMEKFKPQIEAGEIDYHKMYTLVKKQIMKEKKFVP